MALAEAFTLFLAKEIDTLIVVCPYSLPGTWKDQLVTWAIESYQLFIWPHGAPWDVKSKGILQIFVFYYESLTNGNRGGADYVSWLLANRRCMLVVEESVETKNPSAVRTKFLMKEAHKAKYVRELSGWPMVGGPHDMWSQLRILGAHVQDFQSFKHRYCRMGGFKNRQVIGVRESTIHEFRRIMDDWWWMASKKDWADLPPKMWLPPRRVPMSDAQRKHYRSMAQEFLVKLESGFVTAQMVASQMNKLQQISSGFIYDEMRGIHWLDKNPPKLKEMLSVADQNHNCKFIVYAVYRPSIARLYEALAPFGCAMLAGAGSMEERDYEEEKRKFNEDDSVTFALCNPASTKYGVTLLGTEARPCYNALYYENNYDLNARIQTEDRPHRHGQKHAVNLMDFVSSPIEFAAVEALTVKRERAARIFSPSSLEQIREIRGLLEQSIKNPF